MQIAIMTSHRAEAPHHIYVWFNMVNLARLVSSQTTHSEGDGSLSVIEFSEIACLETEDAGDYSRNRTGQGYL